MSHVLLNLCSLSVLTSAGAALMVSTNKMTSILAGKKFNTWLSDAICHSSDSFFMSECGGFSPYGPVLSPTASTSLSLSLKMETRLAVHQLFHEKMCFSRLAAPGILAHDHVVEGGPLAAGFPCKVGPGLFWCHIFNCLHPCLTRSFFSVSQLFPFHSVKVTVSITHKCNMVNPFGLGPRFSCETFKV